MDKEKELIKYKEDNFFVKIKSFFKKILLKNKTDINSSIKNIEHELNKESKSNNEFLDNISIENTEEYNRKLKKLSNEYKNTQEKEEFFKYYNDYKNDLISEQDIPPWILLKINRMLEEELKIKVNDYENLEKAVVEYKLKRD